MTEPIVDAALWRPMRGCPGRSIWTGDDRLTPADLAGTGASVHILHSRTAPDPVHVVRLEAGGLISYAKADGRFVHTLNTPEGFARKLTQLGVALEA